MNRKLTKKVRWVAWLVIVLAVAAPASSAAQGPAGGASDWKVDHRYAPVWWQTSICLPDDWQKTLVGKEGTLLYDFPGKYSGFKTRIGIDYGPETKWLRQELVSPRVPIVRTIKQLGKVEIVEEAFAVGVATDPVIKDMFEGDQKTGKVKADRPPRYDVIRVQIRNTGDIDASVTPVVTIDSEYPVNVDRARDRLEIGGGTYLTGTWFLQAVSQDKQKTVVRLGPVKVQAGKYRIEWIEVLRGDASPDEPQFGVGCHLDMFRIDSKQYWQKLDLPYGRLEIPDPGIQATLDSSIRNIYQAREIKQGLPAFQVGPTCYRGLWVVDGSFLMEAVAMLGRTDEARNGIRYLLSFQRPDGAIMLIDGHLKETGITLWAVTRHARLTNDKKWLAEVWPSVEKGFAYIRSLRQKASADPKSLVYGLLPEGFSDGGLGGINPEYTNVYWTLAGMKAAVDAARWLGKDQEAQTWQREYDDFYLAFRRAAERDARTDSHGNRFVPINMRKEAKISPQKAQWAFLHAVFPGKVFAADDPLVLGNMAMLRAAEAEGLVRDTGWVSNGVWNYFGSFYAHGWLWTGHGPKAARTLYDFANHASPLLCWREEQMPRGEGDAVCGDMPHNWASAEFIRLVRDLLVLERGDELHLFEGLPRAWVQPGKAVRVSGMMTEFGPITLELRVTASGSKATLTLDPPSRNPAKRIVVHLDGWSGQKGTIEVPATGSSVQDIGIKG